MFLVIVILLVNKFVFFFLNIVLVVWNFLSKVIIGNMMCSCLWIEVWRSVWICVWNIVLLVLEIEICNVWNFKNGFIFFGRLK